MIEYKDCLACANSFSEEAKKPNECDKLFCIEKQKYIQENEACKDFN